MTTRNFFTIISLLTISSFIVSCDKQIIEPSPVTVAPTLPDGNRITIHFGTSTYLGCMYSFSNCIWIGWGNATDLHLASPGFQFDNSDEVSAEYGNFFPLTADFTIDSQTGTPPLVLKSGFYRFQLSPVGKKTIVFSDDNLQPVAALVNPNNPQDNIGQLHNLAMQSIYTAQTSNEINALGSDAKAVRQMLTQKSAQFLGTSADLPIPELEQRQIENASFNNDYADHQSWLATSKLSAKDRETLGNILDMASAMPVNSPEQLSQFVVAMTEVENSLSTNDILDDPKLVLSAVSVIKYSRYYWYWKTMTNDSPAARADWWIADVKGLIEGGIGQALVDSLVAALTK